VNMLDCAAVMRQLWDYLDGELDAEREGALRMHLSMCERCTGQAEFARLFLRAVKTARTQAEPSQPLRLRVANALVEAGMPREALLAAGEEFA
jgi:anti-sigma factor (TIGR02949 family)